MECITFNPVLVIQPRDDLFQERRLNWCTPLVLSDTKFCEPDWYFWFELMDGPQIACEFREPVVVLVILG